MSKIPILAGDGIGPEDMAQGKNSLKTRHLNTT